MGCFSMTCAVSGLPINGGHRVYALLLSQNTGGRGDSFHLTREWDPRSLPIEATYNDYGSIEDYDVGSATEAWLDGFRHDLCEIGVGENVYHDASLTLESLSFERLLSSAYHDRLLIHESGVPSLKSFLFNEVPPSLAQEQEALDRGNGQPTVQSVVDDLRKVIPKVQAEFPDVSIWDISPSIEHEDCAPGFVGGGMAGTGQATLRYESYTLGIDRRVALLEAVQYQLRLNGNYVTMNGLDDDTHLRILSAESLRGKNREVNPLKVRMALVRKDVFDNLYPALSPSQARFDGLCAPLLEGRFIGRPSLAKPYIDPEWHLRKVYAREGGATQRYKEYVDTFVKFFLLCEFLDRAAYRWRPSVVEGQSPDTFPYALFHSTIVKIANADLLAQTEEEDAARAEENDG